MYQLATNVWHGQTYARGTRVKIVNDDGPHTLTVSVFSGPDAGRKLEVFPHEIEELSPASH